MGNENISSLGELEFANLSKEQEEKLRGFEEKFNNEFGLDYYFMVMRRKESAAK